MQYCLIKSGAIVDGPRELPRSWRSPTHSISGLDRATPAELLVLGWYPVEDIGFEPFDDTTQVRTGPVDTITDTKVECRWTVRGMTKIEVKERDDAIKEIALIEVKYPALFVTLLDHENRLRGRESQPRIDGTQFLEIIKQAL